jgi:hypothetical protein
VVGIARTTADVTGTTAVTITGRSQLMCVITTIMTVTVAAAPDGTGDTIMGGKRAASRGDGIIEIMIVTTTTTYVLFAINAAIGAVIVITELASALLRQSDGSRPVLERDHNRTWGQKVQTRKAEIQRQR